MSKCADEIKNYLSNGGLFNPELMEHDKVRDLILDCQNEILALERKLCVAKETLERTNFALQCMIINKNGAVPGLTDQQVFEGACEARDKARQALAEIKGE